MVEAPNAFNRAVVGFLADVAGVDAAPATPSVRPDSLSSAG
jgi:hypothetical protein